MSRKKRSKSKKKSNCGQEDLSGILEVNSDNGEIGEREREREKGTAERSGHTAASPSEPPPRKNKTSKEVYFAILPDKYEPLVEDEEEERGETEEERRLRKEEKKMRKKEKHKKYRKNVGKALRFGWRCLVAGLQSFASAYGMPLSATGTLVTEVYRAAASKA